jgi:hypothetical protein
VIDVGRRVEELPVFVDSWKAERKEVHRAAPLTHPRARTVHPPSPAQGYGLAPTHFAKVTVVTCVTRVVNGR